MTPAACGAPDGGAAREAKLLRQKRNECRHKCGRNAGSNASGAAGE